MRLIISSQTAWNRQKSRLISTIKTFQGISNLAILANLHRLRLLKNLQTGRKSSSHVLKNILSEHYRTGLELAISENKGNANATPKTQQLMLIYIEVNIYFNY